MRCVKSDDVERDTITLEEPESIDYAPKFGEMGYLLLKIFQYKRGKRTFNDTVVQVMGNKRFHIIWDNTYGKTYTVENSFLTQMSQTRYSHDVDITIEESSNSD